MDCYRIELTPLARWRDARGEGVKKQIADFLGINVDKLATRDVYTLMANISPDDARKVAEKLANPVLQRAFVSTGEASPADCDYLVAVGFRPGVTDNVGRSAHEAVGDIVGRKLSDDEQVFSSVEYMLSGAALTPEKVKTIATGLLANELIESVSIFSRAELAGGSIPLNLPLVTASGSVPVQVYDLKVADEQLMEISRKGILALSLDEMKVIQAYFASATGRDKYDLTDAPTDVELEVLAQTWSEHCKHKIMDAIINYTDTEANTTERIISCYKSFIKRSTNEIGEEVDFLVSVFHDNAGVITFNDEVDLVYKVETHNSPSALDPYGGAMTGIVGVNRDPLGTGQGANLLINVWGYCLGSPFTNAADVPEGLLHPRRLRDGIHKGVIDGGNQSGIPYGLGWEYFDERYLGKPLVYCGTVGTLPKMVGNVKGFDKSIKPGDLVVMGGGRIGKDGIHGATFSSEELHQNSPVQAVQIGDPITQKKLSDFIYEARGRNLYRFVTDNGAGGLSSSIGEMASLCGGCKIDLAKAPLKYAGLAPWEILVSEAQERMSFAVPKENIDAFLALAAERDVELSVLGEFTDSGKFHILYDEATIALLDIEFMHNGLPRMELDAVWIRPKFDEPTFAHRNLADDIKAMSARLNVASNENKARQYDHEVKGQSVVKPFIGKHRNVVSDATVTMIKPLAREGVVLSAAIAPRYSDIDTYWMMASVIDQAVRRIIAVGGELGHIAGLDNFCWPDPVQSEKTPDGHYKLAQLVRANQALYEFTKIYKVPCISGKDSMKNDSTRGGRKISIPPSVLFSCISRMPDISRAVTLDAKCPGDLVYILGNTGAELGGSEYFAMLGATGNSVPQVEPAAALALYAKVAKATEKKLVRSLHTPALGGLAAAMAKVTIGGDLGMKVELNSIPQCGGCSAAELVFSESNSRFIATVAPENAAAFEAELAGTAFAKVGEITAERKLILTADGAVLAEIGVDELAENYTSALAGV